LRNSAGRLPPNRPDPPGPQTIWLGHAPQQTTVEGTYGDGKLEPLKVTPESRRKDVRVMAEGAGAG